MRPRLAVPAIVFAVACALGAASAAAVNASRPRALTPSPAPETRTWSELEKDATRFLGRRVRFTAQLRGRVDRWSSYVTRFGPAQFDAFQLWTDEQTPWQVDDYEAPLVRVFSRRGSDASRELAAGREYARYEIEGTLRELFLGEPWIEVEDVRELDEHLTEGTVIHASRALGLMDTGAWKLAESELGIALQARMPQRARDELEALRATCVERANERVERRLVPPRPWKGPSPVRRSGGSGG